MVNIAEPVEFSFILATVGAILAATALGVFFVQKVKKSKEMK